MNTSVPSRFATRRFLTRIAGLDRVLQGGLFEKGLYLVLGELGTGKTVLGNQMCFQHVAAGGRAVYLGLLTETHVEMFGHLHEMTFFDTEPIGRSLFYFSGYDVFERDGLPGLLELIRQIVHDQQPTLLVIDGLMTVEMTVQSQTALKRFMQDVHALAQSVQCTTILLTHPVAEQTQMPLYAAIVDGMLSLHHHVHEGRVVRELRVHKLRGSGFLEGYHAFNITTAGLTVQPRLNILPSPSVTPRDEYQRLRFGVPYLDDMLRGGLLTASTTMLLGIPGSGKTLLGLHFLAEGARQGQPGLVFGFNEPPAKLVDAGRQIGLHMQDYISSGRLRLQWQSPLETRLDMAGEQLLAAVREQGVQRLFIDGWAGFQQMGETPERLARFFIALNYELYALNVTTLLAVEMGTLFGPTVEVPMSDIASYVDNVLFLRYVELHSQLYRLFSILKMRRSGYDPSIREFKINEQGLVLADTFKSAEAILTGIARPLTPPPPADAE